MPLPTPILDDRSYQQLRDELVRRVPVYAPEWTDFNASDPGVTLIELFAFLGENLLYRFNQVPEATRLAFLRLLQVPLRPAAPSAALVTLTTAQPAGALVSLGAELRAGLLLGGLSGAIVAAIGYGWLGLPRLAGVIAVAIVAAGMMGTLFGYSVPRLVRRLQLDPKIASGPAVLAITDVAAIACYLGLAAAVL